MIFGVPQFIDLEDKIVGPLTAKQLGWLILATIVALIFYTTLDMSGFIIAAIPTFGIGVALAFYRPYGQSLPSLISNMASFAFSPKVYIWKRISENVSHKPIVEKRSSRVENKLVSKGNVSAKKISEISDILDSQKR